MAKPPQLTPEQRAAALAKAAEARAARAEIKARLKMGSMSLQEALDSDDDNVRKLKVVSMLESLPGVGKVKARSLMEEIGIDMSGHAPVSIDDLHDLSFDLIVTLAPEAQHKAVELTRTMACEPRPGSQAQVWVYD